MKKKNAFPGQKVYRKVMSSNWMLWCEEIGVNPEDMMVIEEVSGDMVFLKVPEGTKDDLKMLWRIDMFKKA